MTDELKNTEAPEATPGPESLDPKELARHLMVAASKFAAASMLAFSEAYPEQVPLLARSGGAFGVRVSDILSTNPRVALVNVVGDEDVEIAHVLLQQPAPMNPLRLN